jgi:4,5-dihydroxyphthalate decarboxylase
MPDAIDLPISLMPYAITRPLLEGRVEVPGVTLNPTPTNSMVWADLPALREGNFGLWDLNLGYLLPAIEAGWQLVALPVFCKRKPAYQFIFCRTDRGIEQPKDLEGKLVGSNSYRTALTVWARGFLQHRHGVDIARLRWRVWRGEHLPNHVTETEIGAPADPRKTPVQALFDGDLDALITDISDVDLFRQLESDPRVRRLFPDYEQEDLRLFRETGVFTAVHLVVMSRPLAEQQPQLARKLYDAFVEAKRLAEWDMLSDRGGLTMPYLRERILESRQLWGDPYPYGCAANKAMVDLFSAYNLEQQSIREPIEPERVFAPGTLET